MNIALIVAAGIGSRMDNADKPKQFLLVEGKPLIIYTVKAFQENADIDRIIIVTSSDYKKQLSDWCEQYGLSKVIDIVLGGDTRQASVYNGLKAIKELGAKDDDIVLIHDGARPLVTQDIISNNIKACKNFDAVDTVIKASDTILVSPDGETISNIPNRNELFQSQTPQTFKFGLVLKAHENAKDNKATDDAKLVLSMGKTVRLVQGNKQNFKVTTPEDLKLLSVLLNNK